MTGVTVKRDRSRLLKLAEEMRYLSTHEAHVGWVDPSKMHPVEDGEKQPMSMAKVAAVMNYGREPGTRADGKPYPAIPARPFMKITFDKNLGEFKGFVNHLYGMLTKGKVDAPQLINMASLRWKSLIQKTMRQSSNFERLADSTVAGRKSRNKTLKKKRANTPLIDTAALINDIGHEVVAI